MSSASKSPAGTLSRRRRRSGDSGGSGGVFTVREIVDKSWRCAELRNGDVILEVDGIDIAGWSHDELVELLRRCPVNTPVRLTVSRTSNVVLYYILYCS